MSGIIIHSRRTLGCCVEMHMGLFKEQFCPANKKGWGPLPMVQFNTGAILFDVIRYYPSLKTEI